MSLNNDTLLVQRCYNLLDGNLDSPVFGAAVSCGMITGAERLQWFKMTDHVYDKRCTELRVTFAMLIVAMHEAGDI